MHGILVDKKLIVVKFIIIRHQVRVIFFYYCWCLRLTFVTFVYFSCQPLFLLIFETVILVNLFITVFLLFIMIFSCYLLELSKNMDIILMLRNRFFYSRLKDIVNMTYKCQSNSKTLKKTTRSKQKLKKKDIVYVYKKFSTQSLVIY